MKYHSCRWIDINVFSNMLHDLSSDEAIKCVNIQILK